MAAILDGYRVLDFTQVLSGPTVTRYLAEMGAEVIKVEGPNGDLTRATAAVRDGRSGFFVSVNRGKRSLCVDLKTKAGLELVRSLIPVVDVVAENFSPGTMDRLGLGWETLQELNPSLVLCSVSGFGQRGPLAHLPGYDGVAQAYAGITSMNGELDGPPIAAGAAVGDILAGVNGVAGILGALLHREKTGEGQRVEISVLDAYMQAHDSSLQSYSVTDGEVIQTRQGRFHQIACPYGIFEASDGYIFICAASNKHWTDVCAAMEQPELAEPSHPWGDRRSREADKVEVNAFVEAWLQRQPSRDAAVTKLHEHRVPAGPMLAIDEVVGHDELRAHGSVTTASDPILGSLAVPGFPLHFSGVDVGFDTEAPFLGEHNAELLGELLGLDQAAIDQLTAEAVLRSEPVPRPSRQRSDPR